jgi:hypothetical protein
MVFHRVTLSDGRLLEYRQVPLYRAFRIVNRWFWLPRCVVRRFQRVAIQRRIDGGSWQYVGMHQ